MISMMTCKAQEVVILLLRSVQAPPYFALKTQLYCVLNDRTVADRELDELR